MNVLLVHPWIHDFAAYDLWLRPWGLWKIAAALSEAGCSVRLTDCLDRYHPLLKGTVRTRANGTGWFVSQRIEKPGVLAGVPRYYRRYGLDVDLFEKAIEQGPVPNAVLVSSGMTYWYGGVVEAIKIVKRKWPGVPVVLGGVYATLCRKHAVENSGADVVIRTHELQKLGDFLGVDMDLSVGNLLELPVDVKYVRASQCSVIRTSLGCPFRCTYCAQSLLGPPGVVTKPLDLVFKQVKEHYAAGVKHFAFYDDALLVDRARARELFEGIAGLKMDAEFHTPNGLHARFMTGEIAAAMAAAGVVDPVLSLETIDARRQAEWHSKVTGDELETAVGFLKEAGYGAGEFYVYLLAGAPGSEVEEVKEAAMFVHGLGAKVSLSEYSPVPGTVMAKGMTEIEDEPLLSNNTLFYAAGHDGHDRREAVWMLKDFVKRLNRKIDR